jgi:PDZ domain-containing protein/carboxypeptidase family protein
MRPPRHHSALTKRRCIFVVGGALVVLLVTVLVRTYGRAPVPRAASVSLHGTQAPPGVRRTRAGIARVVPPLGRAVAGARSGEGASGRVVSRADGSGVPRAEIGFSSDDGAVTTVSADAWGAFVFEPAEPGHFQFATVEAPGFFPFGPDIGQSPVVLALTAGSRVEGVVVELQPKVAYRGEVVDARGAAAAGAAVTIVDTGALRSALYPPGERFTSDARGSFTFSAPDGAGLEAKHPTLGTGRAWVDFRAQIARKVTIRLGPEPKTDELDRSARPVPAPGETAAIAGRVVDPTGAPVTAFGLVVRRSLGALERAMVAAPTFFDAQGRFRLDAVPAGPIVLTAFATGFAPSDDMLVTVGARQSLDELLLAVRAGRTLRGRVVDAADHRPLAGVRLEIEGHGGPEADGTISVGGSASTDADGRFALFGIAPGRGSLVALATGHDAKIVPFDVPAAGDPAPVEFALTPLGKADEPKLEMVGIGAMLKLERDKLVVGELVAGGGAAEAGLVPGDRILAVDGRPVTDLGFAGAVESIRGPEGTTVTLHVRRTGGAEVDVVVTRRVVRI